MYHLSVNNNVPEPENLGKITKIKHKEFEDTVHNITYYNLYFEVEYTSLNNETNTITTKYNDSRDIYYYKILDPSGGKKYRKNKKSKKQKNKKTKKQKEEEPENIKIFIFLSNNRKKINNK